MQMGIAERSQALVVVVRHELKQGRQEKHRSQALAMQCYEKCEVDSVEGEKMHLQQSVGADQNGLLSCFQMSFSVCGRRLALPLVNQAALESWTALGKNWVQKLVENPGKLLVWTEVSLWEETVHLRLVWSVSPWECVHAAGASHAVEKGAFLDPSTLPL